MDVPADVYTIPYAVKMILEAKRRGGRESLVLPREAKKQERRRCRMLRDITIGQHFPGNSLVHRFDPRLKLVLTIAYIVLLFAASNPLGLALSILFLAVMYKVAKIPGKMILKSLKPILPIVIFHGGAEPVLCVRRGRTAGAHLVFDHLCRGRALCCADGGARHGAHRGHQPAHLHHQPHRADGCHRAAAEALGQTALPGA